MRVAVGRVGLTQDSDLWWQMLVDFLCEVIDQQELQRHHLTSCRHTLKPNTNKGCHSNASEKDTQCQLRWNIHSNTSHKQTAEMEEF